jgi:hypothetical protein
MKKLFLLAMSIGIASVHAQIVINQSDIPVPSTANISTYSSAMPSLATGGNAVYNLSNATYAGNSQNIWTPETDPFWTNLGVDVYFDYSKSINSSFYHQTFPEVDHCPSGVIERGIWVNSAATELSSITGNTSDSFLNPQQNIVYNNPKILMPFPFSSTYANKQINRVVINFSLKVPAMGLNNTPGQHVYYDVRKDSVIGWGKMTVWTPSGSSIPYDVLMTATTIYTVDSFYLNGAPAPAPILSAFQVNQGQVTNMNNRIQFNRKGNFTYLLRYHYGTDTTFSTVANAFINTDNISVALGINDQAEYATVLYPNPLKSGNRLNLSIQGNTDDFHSYDIIDIRGNVIQHEKCTIKNNLLSIATDELSSGIYTLSLRGGKSAIHETFTIQ